MSRYLSNISSKHQAIEAFRQDRNTSAVYPALIWASHPPISSKLLFYPSGSTDLRGQVGEATMLAAKGDVGEAEMSNAVGDGGGFCGGGLTRSSLRLICALILVISASAVNPESCEVVGGGLLRR